MAKKSLENSKTKSVNNQQEKAKQSAVRNSKTDIAELDDMLTAKRKKLESITEVTDLIKKSNSLKKVIQSSVTTEDIGTVITIAKNTKYFIFSAKDKEKAKEQLVSFLILECCKQGKIAILEKLQTELHLNFKNFSKEFYERNDRKSDFLTAVAKNQQLEVIKFLLKEESLFLKKGEDTANELIDSQKIIDGFVDFEIPFIQCIFKSNGHQDFKLKTTEFLLEFIKSANYTQQAQTSITNYTINQASKNLAYKALSYLMNYAKNHQLNIEIYKLGLFSSSNKEPITATNYKRNCSNDELTKTILEQKNFNCAESLMQHVESLRQQKSQKGIAEDSFTKDEVQQILKQAQLFIDFKDKNINVLITALEGNTSSGDPAAEVGTCGDGAMMEQTI